MNFPYPFFPVQFTKDGTVFQQSDVDALMSGISDGANPPDDLFIMCHGWNNNMDDATALYSGLAGLIKTQMDNTPALAARKFAICGVLWPSKKFDDKDLIPSGAAALSDAVTVEQLKQRVRDLRALYAASGWPGAVPPPADFDRIEELMDEVEDNPDDAPVEVVKLLRPLLPQSAASTDDASKAFFEKKPEFLVANLKMDLKPPQISAGSSAASIDPFSTGTVSGLGGAAGFRDLIGGVKSGVLHLLNFTTYYLMKARAGDVGVKGVGPIIVQIRNKREKLRIHMIGHSFGCRLVSAAINALPNDEKYRPDTVMLLQGAFSHNGFAEPGGDVERGAFRDVVKGKKVRGPILITHTRNDKAVGLAYPIASRINGVKAAAIGDADDVFGGLGSNGTQTKDSTPEGVPGTLLAVGGGYPFSTGCKPSTPFNLKADAFIAGHSDIQKAEVAFALSVAMAIPAAQGTTGG